MARTLKPGVYQITNTKNGKFYIGSSTINVHRRYFEKLDPVTLEVLGTYWTARECAESVGKFKKEDSSGIMYACRNQTKAFGFKWRSKNVQVKSGELLEKPE